MAVMADLEGMGNQHNLDLRALLCLVLGLLGRLPLISRHSSASFVADELEEGCTLASHPPRLWKGPLPSVFLEKKAVYMCSTWV